MIVASCLLLLVAFTAYGPHVASGGFYSDDWSSLDAYRHLPDSGYWTLVEFYAAIFGGKPLLPPILAVPPVLFGDSVVAWLFMAVALGAATSTCFYLVLRTLCLQRIHAGAIAALTLLVPWSSSGRLWATASVNNVAICFFLIGLVVALRALRRSGNGGRGLHALAVLLYVISVLTYELAGTAALLAGALYLTRAPRREAMTRWASDVVAVSAALVWSAAATEKYIAPLWSQLSQAPGFAVDGLRLLGQATLPFGVSRVAGLLAFVAVIVVALLMRQRGNEELRGQLAFWLRLTAYGIVGVAASYAVLIPSVYWTPLSAGLENRINMMAALPFMLLVYSTWMVAGTLLVRGGRPVLVATTAFAVLASGNAIQLLDQQRAWQRSAELQSEVLAVLREIDRPAAGSTVYVFGMTATVAPRLPVFADTWDLNSAVRLTFQDESLRGYPVFDGARLICQAASLEPASLPGLHSDMAVPQVGLSPRSDGPYYGPDDESPYGSIVFVDVATGRAEVVQDRPGCVVALRTFVPGQFDRAHS